MCDQTVGVTFKLSVRLTALTALTVSPSNDRVDRQNV